MSFIFVSLIIFLKFFLQLEGLTVKNSIFYSLLGNTNNLIYEGFLFYLIII